MKFQMLIKKTNTIENIIIHLKKDYIDNEQLSPGKKNVKFLKK